MSDTMTKTQWTEQDLYQLFEAAKEVDAEMPLPTPTRAEWETYFAAVTQCPSGNSLSHWNQL